VRALSLERIWLAGMGRGLTVNGGFLSDCAVPRHVILAPCSTFYGLRDMWLMKINALHDANHLFTPE